MEQGNPKNLPIRGDRGEPLRSFCFTESGNGPADQTSDQGVSEDSISLQDAVGSCGFSLSLGPILRRCARLTSVMEKIVDGLIRGK